VVVLVWAGVAEVGGGGCVAVAGGAVIDGAGVAVAEGGVAWIHALKRRRRTIGILETATGGRLPDHPLNGSRPRPSDRVIWETKDPYL
jgi:hypothetical protein